MIRPLTIVSLPAIVAFAHVVAAHDEVKVVGGLVGLEDVGANRPGVQDVFANHSLEEFAFHTNLSNCI